LFIQISASLAPILYTDITIRIMAFLLHEF
jgi:hypothetical protein